ncbi:unnamed protein product [Mytilus edulis]|uniref:Uncharacterized protein n=1 Tax=Mytilus edulis TaxID=6550 RepID=A0A8S3USA5_MYTED|nr:unnamed protein product [Mytilus edulis]
MDLILYCKCSSMCFTQKATKHWSSNINLCVWSKIRHYSPDRRSSCEQNYSKKTLRCSKSRGINLKQRRNYVWTRKNERKISDSDYLKFTNELGNGLIEIARVCGNESEVRQQLLDLQKRTLDETLLLQYQVIMLDHVSRDEALNNKVEEIQRQLQTQNKHLRQTVEKAVTVTLPKVLKSFPGVGSHSTFMSGSSFERSRGGSESWDDNAFSDKGQVSSSLAVQERKSRNGLDILRQLGEKYPAYDVVKVSDLHTVDKILNEDSRTIILLEDVFGKTNCRYSEDNDRRFLDTLQAYIGEYSPLFSSHRIFKGFEEINLNSSQFEMTIMEKERLFLNYCSKNNIKIVHVGKEENYTDGIILDKSVTVKINEATSSNIVNTEPYLGFPESCYMFTANRPLTQLGVTFFKHPTSFLNQEIDSLRRGGESNQKDRIRYITLVYILLSSNKLDKQSFDEHKASSILKSCRYRDGFISKSELVDAAEEMTGSYLTYNTETLVFQLQHQTIFESVMLSYYRLDPKSVLNMIDFEMLQEVVKLGNSSEREGEIKMIVPKNLYGDLAKRLFLIFRSQFSQTPSTFIKVLCDSDLMTHIDSDFILQLDNYFFEASNHNITTIITYDGKSEEVVFCFLAVILAYSTIKYWQSEDIKIILFSEDNVAVGDQIEYITSAMTIACEARNIDIVKCVLDKVDHNLIDFKDVTSIVECILDKVDHTLLDMNSAVMKACEAGNTDIVKYILDHIDHEMLDINSVMTAAIKRHDLFIVKYLCNNVNKISLNMKVAFNETCKLGNQELVIWILENVDQSQLDIKTAMLKACRGPNDETVKLLNQRFGENMFDIKSSMNNACRYGNIAVIRWLWSKTDKQHVCDMESALMNACLSGKEGNVKWLVENIDQSQFDIQASITETFVNGINVTNVIKTLLNHSDAH